jgi:fatty acid desaturase
MINAAFKYQEDKYPTSVVVVGVLFSLAPFLSSSPAAWAICAVGLLARILLPIHQHSHSHHSTFTSEPLNAIYDFILSIGGGSCTAEWRVHHGLGHHVDFLDQRNDVEGNLRFGENIPLQRFVFAFLGSNLSAFDSFRILRRFPKTVRRKHQAAMLRQYALQLAVFSLLALLSWKLTLFIFLIPNLLLRMGVFWFSYGQHDNLPMTNVYDSSTTKNKFGSILLNVEFHTAHHERPGLHWTKLQKRTEEILPLIHEKCVR